MKKNIQLISVLSLAVCIFIYRIQVVNNIQIAVNLFSESIFPSLFPFMILSPFLINYGFLDITKKMLGPVMEKIFHLSKNSSYILVMSLLSGFPSSAIFAKELYDNHIIEQKEIEHLLLFCHFSNPIFILTIVQDKPLLILMIHYFLNIFIGILFREKKYKYDNKNLETNVNSFFKLFSSSIKNCMENTLFILGVIVFFFMISSIINNPISNIFLELSQGLNYIKTINASSKIKAALTCSLLSFGGFSVHLQTYGVLSNIEFKYSKYLKARLLHALLSFIIIYVLY